MEVVCTPAAAELVLWGGGGSGLQGLGGGWDGDEAGGVEGWAGLVFGLGTTAFLEAALLYGVGAVAGLRPDLGAEGGFAGAGLGFAGWGREDG